MSIAYVNSGGVFNAAAGTTTQFVTPWSPNPGCTLFVWAYHTENAALSCGDSEGTGNIYVADADQANGTNLRGVLFRCTNYQGSGPVTITITNNSNVPCSIVVAEYSCAPSATLIEDVTEVKASGTASNPTAGAIVTVTANTLIIAATGDVTGATATFAGAANYNLRQSDGDGSTDFVGAYQDRLFAGPGSTTDAFTYSPTQNWIAIQAAYKEFVQPPVYDPFIDPGDMTPGGNVSFEIA